MAQLQYTVKSGDNLSTIGSNYGVDYKTAISGYDAKNPNLIKPGQVLTITTKDAAPAPVSSAPGGTTTMTPTQIAAANAQLESMKATLIGLQKTATGGTTTPTAPSQVQNLDQGTAYVNGNQVNDASSASVSGEPPVRNSVKTYDQVLADIKSAIGVPTGTAAPVAPAAPNLEQNYKDLRTSYGVDTLETSLTDLNKQASDLSASLQAFKDQERNKPVAENVISGRISQQQQTVQEQLDQVNNRISTTTNQLNTKYNVINTLMKYKSDDYTTAKNNYDTQFSQNLQLLSLARGVASDQLTEAERQQDDARANAQIVINTMTARGTTYSALPADEKTTLTKLGVQSGLGANFFSNVLNVSAGKEILTTITSADQTSATIVYKDGSTKSISTGLPAKVVSGDKPTADEIKVQYKNNMVSELKKVTGTDGYLSPEDWAKARRSWASNTPYTAADFDANFRDYVNPQHPQDYAGFEEYRAGFKKS